MDQRIQGIPIGTYPEIGEARIVYKTPPEYLKAGFNQLVTLGKNGSPNTFVMTFWTWGQDHHYKNEIKGTWCSKDVILSNRHLKAFKKIEVGGL